MTEMFVGFNYEGNVRLLRGIYNNRRIPFRVNKKDKELSKTLSVSIKLRKFLGSGIQKKFSYHFPFISLLLFIIIFNIPIYELLQTLFYRSFRLKSDSLLQQISRSISGRYISRFYWFENLIKF